MANELAPIERLQVPDLRKPTAMPSLPAWLATQRAALTENLQMVGERFQDVLTLPENLMPSPAQRAEMQDHIADLRSWLARTPANSPEAEAETLATVTKLMLVLGGAKASELAAEAKIEAFMGALDDVPSWAVEAAARRWYRGDCGTDERGNPYNYAFAPDPASLRRIAGGESYRAGGRIHELEKILTAHQFVDSTSQLERGRKAWRGLWHTIRDGGNVGALTFDDAVRIGGEESKPA